MIKFSLFATGIHVMSISDISSLDQIIPTDLKYRYKYKNTYKAQKL